MNYLHFYYKPFDDDKQVFKKLLELNNCKIYVNKGLFIRFLKYLNLFSNNYFQYTSILKFPKLNKTIYESVRVGNGIFYLKKEP